MASVVREREKKGPPAAAGRAAKATRLIGWQGLLVDVPENWDLTGFTGDEKSGYVRIDDGAEQALEIKWATESEPKRLFGRKPAEPKTPDVSVRRESYFRLLRQNAKKKKLTVQTHEADAPRAVLRPERTAVGFHWTADRKGIGAVWHCATCRRTVIAQVLGAPSGKGGLAGVADAVLGTLRCHGDDRDEVLWSLYDLTVRVPAEYRLVSQELMNVYLRLTFERGLARLSVEQWSLANVARRGAYLDTWLASNSRAAEVNAARYRVEEAEMHGHPAIALSGGLAFGLPMVQALRDATQLRRPATRFSAVAWECEESNKLFAVSELRPANRPAMAAAVAERTVCHGVGSVESQEVS